MIPKGATLTIQRIPLTNLQPVEMEGYFPEKFAIYLDLLRSNPDLDVDPIVVTPSVVYPDMFNIGNGKHRYFASVIAGRPDILSLVVEGGDMA